LGAASLACSRPLPDPDSPGAKAYVQECGLCHAPHDPGLLTPAMWQVQVERMEEQRRRRGLPPMTPDQTKLILDYLTAHAG
jgi:hypothetical protein